MTAALLSAACTDSSSARDAAAGPITIPPESDASISAPDTFRPPEIPPGGMDAALLKPPCNGSPSTCDKRYDEICQAATHDSLSSLAYWHSPAQDRTLRSQLENSIRVFMLTVAEYQSVVSVCQTDCDQGNVPLATVLTTVKEFLDNNPREVVTLLLDTAVPAGQLAAEFVAKKLDTMAHAQSALSPWPTLGDMIAAGHRLVVLSGSADAGPSWLLRRQDFVWETGSHWTSLQAMTCNPVVGTATRPLYLVHHDLVEAPDGGEESLPSITRAAEANAFPAALARLQQCKNQFGHAPNYMALDFFEIGDAQGATMVMNGLRTAPAGTQ